MINNVVLTGRCVDTPELKVTTSGTNVASFTIANETGYGDHKRTNFINIVAWKKTAEFVAKYFQKGDAIGITGEIQTRKYQDKNGNNRTVVEVVANEVHFIESKKNDAAGQKQEESPRYDEQNMPQYDGELPF